jgi:endonuclease-8
VAVCFSAPHVVLQRPGAARVGSGTGPGGLEALTVGRLGPDLCGADPDRDEILRRLDGLPAQDTPLATVLLDQRLFCGVGNVYKSEVLSALGLHPATPIGWLGPDARLALIETAHRLLRANLATGVRATVAGGLAVYGRAGRPCRRCGRPIQWARSGPQQRSTYWCPRCQPAPDDPATAQPRNRGGTGG